jgi:hypothetical protein
MVQWWTGKFCVPNSNLGSFFAIIQLSVELSKSLISQHPGSNSGRPPKSFKRPLGHWQCCQKNEKISKKLKNNFHLSPNIMKYDGKV